MRPTGHGLLAIVVVAAALIHIEQSGYYVSGPWRRSIWIVMAVVLIGLLVWVRLIKPWMLLRRPYTVTDVRAVAPQVWALTVEADGHEGLRFDPGQFAWLMVDRSPFGVREHPFSFSSSAELQGSYEFTIKELGDFTSTVGEIEPGTRAYLDGPFGAFSSERRQGAGYLLVAGGVGISPMMSMLRTMAELEEARPVTLLYGSPTWDEVIYADELEALADRLDLTVVHVLEEPPADWTG